MMYIYITMYEVHVHKLTEIINSKMGANKVPLYSKAKVYPEK